MKKLQALFDRLNLLLRKLKFKLRVDQSAFFNGYQEAALRFNELIESENDFDLNKFLDGGLIKVEASLKECLVNGNRNTWSFSEGVKEFLKSQLKDRKGVKPMKLHKSSYQRGVDHANSIIRSCHDRGKVEKLHDKADGRMWGAFSKKDRSEYSYQQGMAMGLGYYAHSGKTLKK
jgi:hypothetical protein